MYFYLYDSFLSEGRYGKEMSEVENYLTDLGIAGAIERVSIFKTVKDILKNAVTKKGATTIVIVGNDNTFREAIKYIPDFNITLGFIPVGQQNHIAKFLGIPCGAASCDTLSARIIEKIDIGRINDRYFLSSVSVPKTLQTIDCDGKYSISLKEVGNVTICNAPFGEEMRDMQYDYLDPRDGKLDLFIQTAPISIFGKVRWWFGGQNNVLSQSHFITKKIRLCSENPITIFVDKTKVEDKNFDITLAEEKIKIIIGKGRMF